MDDTHAHDEFHRRRNEEQRQAEARRLADRAAAFENEITQLRQFLASVDAPADVVEEKVKQLQGQQAARAATEDAPARRARMEGIAARFGLQLPPES